MTKSTLIAAVIAGSMAFPVVAGGMSDPVMEADIIVQDISTPSSGSAALPIIMFALLVALASSN